MDTSAKLPEPDRRSTGSEKSPPSSESPPPDRDIESRPRGFGHWFGSKDMTIGPRIAPISPSMVTSDTASEESSEAMLHKQLESEEGCAIQYRTCSWQKVCLPVALLWGFVCETVI